MNILALDLGSKLGFAIYSNDSIESGTKKLSRKTFGSRFSEFRCWLMKIITQNRIDIVYFERVYRHNGTEAAHVFGGFMYIWLLFVMNYIFVAKAFLLEQSKNIFLEKAMLQRLT